MIKKFLNLFHREDKTVKNYWLAVALLGIVGIAVSAYLIHLTQIVNSGEPLVCDLSAKFSCSTVATSKYSKLFGIPVAIWGTAAYSLMTIAALYFAFAKKVVKAIWILWALFLAGSLAFTLYLTGIEIFVLKTACIFCLIQQAIILIMAGLMIPIYKKDKRLK